MAEILCGAEPAVAAAAAAAAGAGVVSETVSVACEPPIMRARRKRRLEYARRYGGGSIVRGGLGGAVDPQKRMRRQAAEGNRRSTVVGEDGGEGEGAMDRELGLGGGGGGGALEEEAAEGDEGGLVQFRVPGTLSRKDWYAPPATASGVAPGYGMASVRGRRREMEDAVSIRPDFLAASGKEEDDDGDLKGLHYFGVFDGHGCSHVAVSCKDRMHELLSQELTQQKPLLGVKDGDKPPHSESRGWDWGAVMGRVFARMDCEVVLAGRIPGELSCGCELQQASKCDHVGSTAVVAVVTGDRIVVANCGDSRAVMCRRGGIPVPLSQDHKPDRPDELQRIQAAGGRVIYWDGSRVLGVLAMSRAIGDSHLKPYVTSEPEVTVTARTEADEFLILATDGLWDVVSNATACQVVRTYFKACSNRNGSAGSASTAATTAAAGGLSSLQPLLEGAVVPPTGNDEDGGGGAGEDRQAGSDKACLEAAVLLTRLALARRSSDNVSVVVVDLRR